MPRPAHPEGTRRASGAATRRTAIQPLDTTQLLAELAAFCTLLEDAVESGASIGFIHPMPEGEAEAYWRSVVPALEAGSLVLLVARDPTEGIMGTVQLDCATRPNGLHRAEIAKLMVLRPARRHGIGRALMLAAEAEAQRLGRTTLVLDTRLGDDSERLYRALGWQLTGVVPRYARSSTGKLDATAFYHKLLD
jgi:acetyltransferase